MLRFSRAWFCLPFSSAPVPVPLRARPPQLAEARLTELLTDDAAPTCAITGRRRACPALLRNSRSMSGRACKTSCKTYYVSPKTSQVTWALCTTERETRHIVVPEIRDDASSITNRLQVIVIHSSADRLTTAYIPCPYPVLRRAVHRAGHLARDGAGGVGIAEQIHHPVYAVAEADRVPEGPEGHGKAVHAVGAKVGGDDGVAVVLGARVEASVRSLEAGLRRTRAPLCSRSKALKLRAVPCECAHSVAACWRVLPCILRHVRMFELLFNNISLF